MSQVKGHRKKECKTCFSETSAGDKSFFLLTVCLKKRRNEGNVITLISTLHSANIYSVFDLTFHSVSSSHVFTLLTVYNN